MGTISVLQSFCKDYSYCLQSSGTTVATKKIINICSHIPNYQTSSASDGKMGSYLCLTPKCPWSWLQVVHPRVPVLPLQNTLKYLPSTSSWSTVSHVFTKWSETISRRDPLSDSIHHVFLSLLSLQSALLIIKSPESKPEMLALMSPCHCSLRWPSGAGFWWQWGERSLLSYLGLQFIPYFPKQLSKLQRINSIQKWSHRH